MNTGILYSTGISFRFITDPSGGELCIFQTILGHREGGEDKGKEGKHKKFYFKNLAATSLLEAPMSPHTVQKH
jgi:hypothetical protein